MEGKHVKRLFDVLTDFAIRNFRVLSSVAFHLPLLRGFVRGLNASQT